MNKEIEQRLAALSALHKKMLEEFGKVIVGQTEVLEELLITVFAGGRVFDYKVTDTFIVQEKDVPMAQRLQNARWIGAFPDDRITMLTCWPPNNNTHRAFVIAKPVQGAGH